METLLLIAVLAGSWHICLAILESRLGPRQAGQSLSRLLLLAEVEVLRTLRAELRRRRSWKGGGEEKLSRVEARLEELGEDVA